RGRWRWRTTRRFCDGWHRPGKMDRGRGPGIVSVAMSVGRIGFALAGTLGAAAGASRAAAEDVSPAAPFADLGGYEATALAKALAERGLTIDPAPDGKRIGTIHVVNHDV